MTVENLRDAIVEEGYCVIESVIPPNEVSRVKDSVLHSAATHKVSDPRSKLDKVSGFINVDQSFAPYLTEPRLLGLCKTLLGEHVRISYTTCMVTHPGNERGQWHADWPFNQQCAGHIPAPYGDALVHLTTIWMLTPFTSETGTLIVPGSHREPNNPTGDNGTPLREPHPGEIAVTGDPGSVLVLDSRMWHAITPNRSDRPRVIMPIRYAPWWLNLESLRPGSDVRDRLTESGLSENTVPPLPPDVFEALPEDVKPLFRHWIDRVDSTAAPSLTPALDE